MSAPTIAYIGEQTWWGQTGHTLVIVSFITALFAFITNLVRTRSEAQNLQWQTTSRRFFYIHALAVIGIFTTLLMMLIYHRFEYQYVWQHSKRDMSMNYVLACLWEGQEGSTLLWMLWHAVIGLILVRKAGEWEPSVVAIVALVQVFLSMMLLGIYVGDVHIGSNPFALIREREENIGLPWTQLPDYLTRIPMFRDGRGLNPLLQNYWMTIHPPTLFLGFALVTVPFAYAIGGLWTKKLHDWQRPALPWAFAGVMILGTGILMGGAWAYESLSFGGFWAWDPVENASLVPWLTLVGAAHVMLIYRIKGQSLFTTFFLTIISFLLIVYSTFLTKSGILSETSVHAFTEDGLNEELTLYMGFFLWLSLTLMILNNRLRLIYTVISVVVLVMFLNNQHALSMLLMLLSSLTVLILAYNKYFPKTEKEEELLSREFWMFIGAVVMMIASFQIIFYTSSPVVNKFLKTEILHSLFEKLHKATDWTWAQKLSEARIAPDKDVVHFYNKWQIPFAVIVTILMGITQYFKYKNSDWKEVLKKLFMPFVLSLILSVTIIMIIYFNAEFGQLPGKKKTIYIMSSFLLFATIFSVFANGDYWLRILKGKIKNAGASVAHIGFGLLLLGALISTSKKEQISHNTSRFDIKSISQDGSNEENIYLRKGDTLPMGKYLVTYTERIREIKDGTPYVYFNVDFLEKAENGTAAKSFSLRPFIQLNKFMGNAAEPDTRHFLHKDIYTFIKFVPMSSLEDSVTASGSEAYDTPQNHTLAVGDTIGLENCIAVLDSIQKIGENHPDYKEDEYGIAANFTLTDDQMKKHTVIAYYFINKNTGVTRQKDAMKDDIGVKLTFWKVRPENGKIDVYSSVKLSAKKDFIVMEASVFPGINILWIGCIVMIIGTAIAVRERIRSNRSAKQQ
ncbi:MAG: cytochrome c biogenesis protein CcsA [Bacteroidia bacterium]